MCLIHIKRPSIHHFALEPNNRSLGLRLRRHLDKAKASGLAAISVSHNTNRIHLTKRLKLVAQFIISDIGR
jgi:hypothetical protein